MLAGRVVAFYLDRSFSLVTPRVVRTVDHVVVDVPSLDSYAGPFMPTADGMKVYVFCYNFGYVVTVTDPALAVLSCRGLPEITTPDVVVAEMMVDGSMVRIATLAVNAITKLSREIRSTISRIASERPPMIYRRAQDTVPTTSELTFSGVPSDLIVLTTHLRNLRLKRPTVDLLYAGGSLNALENGLLIAVVQGHTKMAERVVYEMDILRDAETGMSKLVRLRPRVLKRVSNPLDVVTLL
jgi:hypothetical protein